ncbi:hypothetical protein ACO0R3_002686 [Hanseniaspora guilliermondii]
MNFYKGCSKLSLRSEAIEHLIQIAYEDENDNSVIDTTRSQLTVSLLKGKNNKSTIALQSYPLLFSEIEILIGICETSPTNVANATSTLTDVIIPYFQVLSKQLFSDIVLNKFSASKLKKQKHVTGFSIYEVMAIKLSQFMIRCHGLFDELKPLVETTFANFFNSLNSKFVTNDIFIVLGIFKAANELCYKSTIHEKLVISGWKFLSLYDTKLKLIVQNDIGNETLSTYYSSNEEITSDIFLFEILKIQNKILGSIFIFNEQCDSFIETMLILKRSNEVNPENYGDVYEKNLHIFEQNKDFLTVITLYSKNKLQDLEDMELDVSSFENLNHFFEIQSLLLETCSLNFFNFNVKNVSSCISMFKRFVSIFKTNSFLPSASFLKSIVAFASLMNYYTDDIASDLVSFFPVLITNTYVTQQFVENISKIFADGLPALTEDAVVNSIYDISNLLGEGREKFLHKRKMTLTNSFKETEISRKKSTSLAPFQSMNILSKVLNKKNKGLNGSSSSLNATDGSQNSINESVDILGDAMVEDDYAVSTDASVEKAVVSLVTIAATYKDNSITGLILTILIQKYDSVSSNLDVFILENLHTLAVVVEKNEFNMVVKFLHQINLQTQDEHKRNVLEASKDKIAMSLKKNRKSNEDVYNNYLKFLLEDLDSNLSEKSFDSRRSKKADTDQLFFNIKTFNEYILLLAALLPGIKDEKLNVDNHTESLMRDLWIKLATHGFYFNVKSQRLENCLDGKISINPDKLKIIALNTTPLAAFSLQNTSETSYKLNMILQRPVLSTITDFQCKALKREFGYSGNLTDDQTLFLTSAIMLEYHRLMISPEDAICLTLEYMTDETIEQDFGSFFESFAKDLAHTVCSAKRFRLKTSLEHYSTILTSVILKICSRNKNVQKSGFFVADKMISYLPECLNTKDSVFLCLDLLSTLYQSVYDVAKNKYQLNIEYIVGNNNTVSLPLSEAWRNDTLRYFEQHCSSWFDIIISRTPKASRALLLQYISSKIEDNFSTMDKVNYGVSFAKNKATSLGVGVNDPDSYLNQKIDYSFKSLNGHWTSVDHSISFFTASSSNQLFESKLLQEQYKELKTLIFTSNAPDQKSIHLFLCIASKLLSSNLQKEDQSENANYICDIINSSFIKGSGISNLSYGVSWWGRILSEYPQLSGLFLTELVKLWDIHIRIPGFILNENNGIGPCEESIMQYTPSNTDAIISRAEKLLKESAGYIDLLKFIEELSIKIMQFSDNNILSECFVQLVKTTTDCMESTSNINTHPALKFLKLRLFGTFFKVSESCHKRISKKSIETMYTVRNLSKVVTSLTKLCLKLFSTKSLWPFGNDELAWDELYVSIKNVYKIVTSSLEGKSNTSWNKFLLASCATEMKVLQKVLVHEMYSISIWSDLSSDNKSGRDTNIILSKLDESLVKSAFSIDIKLSANLIDRYVGWGGVNASSSKERVKMNKLFSELINLSPLKAAKSYGSGLKYLSNQNFVKYGLLFDKVDPMSTLNYLLDVGEYNKFVKSLETLPLMLQYFMKSLESFSSQVTFFYIPQIVQCLRYDNNGYVERFILDSGMINSYFAHQIIWNMKANKYKDDSMKEVDPILGPKLYTIIEKLEATFSAEALEFYKNEFKFFSEVTQISGTLKPYVKKSKPEKKQVIDAEMAKIKVLPGVYLPSNPDGVVVDIDRKSGKPLQSHAKAPFMATFKIEKTDEDGKTFSQPLSAIFKVGDDCRQDVLALQLINCCKNIWSEIGLDVYVFPNRVTATDGGCGVIDVLPNSISRDMLGREAVNGLYEWFVSKFGSEYTPSFEKARMNFIKSLAGYSVISYILQFKDRHNGNIMYDDSGHVLHIDFGFIFDIVPGGVKFEAVPFKLTKEMVSVLGGSKNSLGYRLFEKLTIKAFLALRKHYKFIQNTIEPMMDSNLPCFGGKTIKHLQSRLALDKSEAEAAVFMKNRISRSYESTFTKGYDEFQKMTNGIPY